jgi:phosphopantothenoylcysteine decarboxylase/phosphopantothenate--cysteine ligase
MKRKWLFHPQPLSERRVLVGISGGESIFTALELLRDLSGNGIPARAVLGPDVPQWAGPRLFQEITGQKALCDAVTLSARLEEGEGLPYDVLAVVGATPRVISRIAKGIPDDAVSVAALSLSRPVLLIPGGDMTSGALRENLQRLSERGFHILRGEEPPGREKILSELLWILAESAPGVPVLVTAGGTREPLDPVRYLSNYSSGRTGCAIARAARDAGHKVALIRGPGGDAKTPAGVEEIRVETAQDMLLALKKRHKRFPVLIMAAAVADYRAAELSTMKIRRDREERELKLAANPDILAALRNERRDLVTVGFAIEGGLDKKALQGAKEKVETKGLDFIVLNDPQRPDTAFGGPTARVRILWGEAGRGVEDLPTLSKEELGHEILTRAVSLLSARYGLPTAP